MRVLISLTTIIVMSCLVPSSATAQAACRPADDHAEYLFNKLTTLMLNANPNDGESRNALQVPLVTTNEISLVTDSIICSSVLSAYNAALGPRGTGATASTQVTVVKVGNDRYVVFDPAQTAGEYVYQMTLNGQYGVLGINGT